MFARPDFPPPRKPGRASERDISVGIDALTVYTDFDMDVVTVRGAGHSDKCVIVSPWLTCVPTETSNALQCAYRVDMPSPWSIIT